MSHIPVNHSLRPLYRTLGALVGVYLLVFGAIGFAETQGEDLFAQGGWTALGLPTNRGFALLSLLAGAVVLTATLIGRNVDHFVNLWAGGGFLIAGTAMLALTNTDINFLNASVATAVVSYVIGLILLTSGLYNKAGTADQATAEEAFRHRE